MEFDLAALRKKTKAEQFVRQLQHVCEITLTSDFWNVTLPNDLATSSSRSPSLFAYDASLVLLDAPVLFSKTSVADLLDPAIHSDCSDLQRDYLFHKTHLASLGITDTRETNQIANYAYVESPHKLMEYLPDWKQGVNPNELSRMYRVHALPSNWENMEFPSFLEIRRKMMAEIIREGYQRLITKIEYETEQEDFDLAELINQSESKTVEFKSTLRTNLATRKIDKRMEMAVPQDSRCISQHAWWDVDRWRFRQRKSGWRGCRRIF